jgi:hypothetical protein
MSITKEVLAGLTIQDVLNSLAPDSRKGGIQSWCEEGASIGSDTVMSERKIYIGGKVFMVQVHLIDS